jgi:hypothetical protein
MNDFGMWNVQYKYIPVQIKWLIALNDLLLSPFFGGMPSPPSIAIDDNESIIY